MAALAKFLGKEVPMRAGVGGEIEFPHVKTPSAHWEKTDVPPPADELDPNEDLWGEWSGGVPAGKLKWAKDLSLMCAKPPCAAKQPQPPSAEKSKQASAPEACPQPEGWCVHPGATNTYRECGGKPGHWCTDTYGKAGFAACDEKIERTWGALKTWGNKKPVTCEEAPAGGPKKLKASHAELIPTKGVDVPTPPTPTKKTSEKKTSEKKTSEKKTSEKKTSEKKTSEKKTSAQKAAELSEDELCPGHPHILRSSASCLTRHEEPVRNIKRLATKREEPKEEDEPEWLRKYKEPA